MTPKFTAERSQKKTSNQGKKMYNAQSTFSLYMAT